jgi:hypothetical protein
MPVGKVEGAIIAKVIKRPNNVTSFLNIVIQDEEMETIQCCAFGP